MNTSYQIGSAVGLAALTVLSSAVAAGGTSVDELTGGYAAAFLGAAVLAAVGGITAAATLRGRLATKAEETELVGADA